MKNINSPFHPIIYVRGYAMTKNEIDDASADPFYGFNLGSTIYRAVTDRSKPPSKFIFQSPLIRLITEHQYENVYRDGCDILDKGWEYDATGKPTGNELASRSLIIFRYYDIASSLLGNGKTPSIKELAKALGDLILRTRELICKNAANQVNEEDFRCHLVAHSMGGLICRALLQNSANDPQNARRFVDKFFTYATPHNGIEMAGLHVPGWLSKYDMNNFSRETMAKYLGLDQNPQPKDQRVDWIREEMFPAKNVFCMVGTNRSDYDVAMGLSRTFAGNGSDGLVKIENATLRGLKSDGTPGAPCAKAFAYRSHSGFYGIVNSEEAYQNLTRFLFGNVRVDLWLDITDIRLPLEAQKQQSAGKKIDALYQIEVLASPRGKPWYLTRRTAVEDSVACLNHSEWLSSPQKRSSVYLSSVFLANHAKVDPDRGSLAYSMRLVIRTPDYEIDEKLWFKEHYEGGYLFNNAVIIEITPPISEGTSWKVSYAWQGTTVNLNQMHIDASTLSQDSIEVNMDLPTDVASSPGIQGQLRLTVSAWN